MTVTRRKPGKENRNVIGYLLPMSHNCGLASQNRHEPGLLPPMSRAISGKGSE
jgi:hypothetical protein